MIEPPASEAAWAKLALLWYRELPESQRYPGMSPRNVVEQAITAWIQRSIGRPLRCFDFDVSVAFSLEEALGYGYGGAESDPLETWHLAISHAGTQTWLMDRLDDLDAVAPGLTETAWNLVSASAARTLCGLAPTHVAGYAERVWWYGCTTQEDLEEELRLACEMSDEEIAGFPGVSWWEAQYPSSVRDARRVLKTPALERLAERRGELSEVIADLATLSRMIDRHHHLPMGDWDQIDAEPANFGIVLGLSEDGRAHDKRIQRFVDDWYDMVNACGDGYTDIWGFFALNYDAMALRRWKVQMQQGWAMLGAIDRVIERMGTLSAIGD